MTDERNWSHGTGKTGNLDAHFSRLGIHREFVQNIGNMFYTGILPEHRDIFEVLNLKYQGCGRMLLQSLSFVANVELGDM